MENKSIEKVQNEIVEEFEMLGDDWSEKYQHIISLGKAAPSLPENLQTEENKVRGCQSNVWLVANWDGTNITFEGESDALIVKGLVALVIRVFSGHTPDDILKAQPLFIERIGLGDNLSPTRNNGLAAMIKQMKFYALGYKAKSQAPVPPSLISKIKIRRLKNKQL